MRRGNLKPHLSGRRSIQKTPSRTVAGWRGYIGLPTSPAASLSATRTCFSIRYEVGVICLRSDRPWRQDFRMSIARCQMRDKWRRSGNCYRAAERGSRIDNGAGGKHDPLDGDSRVGTRRWRASGRVTAARQLTRSPSFRSVLDRFKNALPDALTVHVAVRQQPITSACSEQRCFIAVFLHEHIGGAPDVEVIVGVGLLEAGVAVDNGHHRGS
jgi:hypothetical protein